jgi:superfamily I DNA/RNA helicase
MGDVSVLGKLTFISAGAGSGKTHRLTQILHEQLLSGGVRPSGVIATTFTKKAATELRERVRSHLLSQGASSLAHAMGQARIGTVNSVCGSLLGRFAFEAGLATEQQVLEEDQAAIIIGYSLPATDSHFKYLMSAGLRDNISFRKILFVNSASSATATGGSPAQELEQRLFRVLRPELKERGIAELVFQPADTFFRGVGDQGNLAAREHLAPDLEAVYA